jgi:pyruvate ferredoxin oxidoreductase alpha subunit
MHIIENGNVAAALGVKLCRANVIAAYPITPQTPLTEKLSEYVESGEMKAEYIPVESEHSALAVCIAASSAGPMGGWCKTSHRDVRCQPSGRRSVECLE